MAPAASAATVLTSESDDQAIRHAARVCLSEGVPAVQLALDEVHAYAQSCQREGDFRSAGRVWERAATFFAELGDDAAQCRVQIQLSRLNRRRGDFQGARRAGQAALAAAETTGEPELEARATEALAAALIDLGEHEQAGSVLLRGRVIAGSAGLPHLAGRLAYRAARLAVLRNEQDAGTYVAEAMVAATEVDAGPVMVARVRALQAVCAARAGERYRAEELALEALDLVTGAPPTALADVELSIALSRLESGEVDAARPLVEAVARRAHRLRNAAMKRGADELQERLESSASGPSFGQRYIDYTMALPKLESLDEVLEATASAAQEITGADRAFVVLQQGEDLVVRASITRSGEPAGHPVMSVVTRSVLLASELEELHPSDRRLGSSSSILGLDLGALLCVPLIARSEVLGALYVDCGDARTMASGGAWGLRVLAAQAALAIAHARDVEELALQVQRARSTVHDMKNLVMGLQCIGEELAEDPRIPADVMPIASYVTDASLMLREHALALLRGDETASGVVELEQVTLETARLMAPEARRRGVELVVDASTAHTEGNALHLARILSNLLANALRYAPAGTTIHVSLRAEDPWCVWQVRDEGEGFGDELLADALRRGVAAEASEGFGLGLSIVDELAQCHHGSVALANGLQGGGLVTVKLPCYRPS